MSKALRELERIEWRAHGALRFVDATTGTTIQRPLLIDAPGAKFTRNRSALYVLSHWDDLSAHENEFLAQPFAPLPSSRTLKLNVADPEGTYLPIVYNFKLPRVALPAFAGEKDSLFQAQTVPLYPSTTAPVGANWAVLRVSLSTSQGGDSLGGALLRVSNNGKIMARGLTDWRGEALLPVMGVPVTTFSEDVGAVVISEINVSLRAAFDPSSGSRTPLTSVHSNQPPSSLPAVDPDALEANFEALPNTPPLVLGIAARRSQTVSLTLELP